MENEMFELYLEEMEQIAPLTEAEREEVLKKTAQGDAAARNRLVEGSLKEMLTLVKEIGVGRLALSDAIQEANTALLLAAVEYDASEDWQELMSRSVREAVELAVKEQETELDIEENMAARVNALQTVSQRLAEEYGREATLEELARTMKMSEDEVKEIMKLALDALTVTGEGAVSGGEE